MPTRETWKDALYVSSSSIGSCAQRMPQHNTFYLQPDPARSPTLTCWYSKKMIGHTMLSSTVGRLCRLAGIEGYYTNHSLCATITTRLYKSGINKQLVVERTDHRSMEGVRSYKRTSDEQREAISDLLNCEQSTLVVSAVKQYKPSTIVALLQHTINTPSM